MVETPSDSGESPDSISVSQRSREQLRRPGVWSLIVLVAVVLALQVWLLFF